MNQWHDTDNFPNYVNYKLIYYYSYERAKVSSSEVKGTLQHAKETITVIMNRPWSPGEILFAGAFMHEIPSSHPNSNKD